MAAVTGRTSPFSDLEGSDELEGPVARRSLFMDDSEGSPPSLQAEDLTPRIREYFSTTLPNQVAQVTEIIRRMNFSRNYHLEELRYPSHDEMNPLFDEFEQINAHYSQFKDSIPPGATGLNQQFNDQISGLIRFLAEKIREDATTSRQLEFTRVVNGSLSPKNDHTQEEYLPIIEQQISEFDRKPIARPLLELRDLLNISHQDHDRKGSGQELKVWKFLWDFFQQKM